MAGRASRGLSCGRDQKEDLMRNLIFSLALSVLLVVPFQPVAASRTMCKEKVMGTETVEGIYLVNRVKVYVK